MSERERHRRLAAASLRMPIDRGERVDDDSTVATLRDALDAVDPAPDDSGVRWPYDRLRTERSTERMGVHLENRGLRQAASPGSFASGERIDTEVATVAADIAYLRGRQDESDRGQPQ